MSVLDQFKAQNEQIDSNVEQASIALKMGLLTMESKISAANGEVLQKQTNVTNAQKQWDEAKGSTSNSLVQNLIDAYQDVKQQEANLEAAQKDLEDLKDFISVPVSTIPASISSRISYSKRALLLRILIDFSIFIFQKYVKNTIFFFSKS